MSGLPVIVGFGGYNAAGRSSFHQGFRRMVIESIDDLSRQETIAGLAVMMKLVAVEQGQYVDTQQQSLTLEAIEQRFGQQVLEATLIRRIEVERFDIDNAHWHQAVDLSGEATQFTLSRRQLPHPVPESWSVEELSDKEVRVTMNGELSVKIDATREMPVKSAGQLPTGFDPAELYTSRFHPRGLQMTIVGVTDAIRSMGIDWQDVVAKVEPDEIAVFSGCVMSQLDANGLGGMMQSRLRGSRVSAKQLPLGLNTMPADFINAYVLGSVGTTGSSTGACASFLYNLRVGIDDIQAGKCRVAIIGNSEAPVTPEIVDGFAAMSALATAEGLKKLDGVETPDLRRSSRPFGQNCGFTIAESSQYIILMDDELALELGADIHGAATDVFINADGYKKSISAPGPGNYITLAKAVAAARELVGDEGIRQRSFVHAHGSSTPANRVTESDLFDRVGEAFGISDWPVTAVKSYVGHSIGPASGDQLISALGSFKYNLVPGIKTIDSIAEDVHQKNLNIPLVDLDVSGQGLDVAFINSKGFGGNNATGVILAPRVVESMLYKRHGQALMDAYQIKRQATMVKADAYNERALKGDFDIIYNFGKDMIDDADLDLSSKGIHIPGFTQPVSFKTESRYNDMLD